MLNSATESGRQEPAGAAHAGATESRKRILFDVSSIVRWVGPAVGIIRTEHALAAYARAMRPDVVPFVYDQATASFRSLAAPWAEIVTGWAGAIDMVTFDHRRHRSWLRNCRSPRYPLVMALEGRRLATRPGRLRRAIEAAQELLWLSRRLPPPFADHLGRRLAVVPVGLALGEKLQPGPEDTIATAGYDWFHQDPIEIGKLKRRHRFRYVVMCYDIIPLQLPEMFAAHDVAAFRRYWHAVFPMADRILVNSRRVEVDIRDYCATAGLQLGEMQVTPLGFERTRVASDAVLATGLEPGRFALFVSTIEPRKGHDLLIGVWRRLLAAGVPQRHRFKLAFVGRRGWKVEAVLRQIDDQASFEGTLVHLENIGDGELEKLYGSAAFCLYPSRYEGFGLPIVEAFSHGKAVLASTGGALPETVGDLSPCLDPGDEEAWFAYLRDWIEDPGRRAPYEARIRASFSHADWQEAAGRYFDAVGSAGPDVQPNR